MPKKILLLILIALCFFPSMALAKYVYTFNCVELNVDQANKVTKDLDKAYENWKVVITPNLTWNSTTGLTTALNIFLEKKDSTAYLGINFVKQDNLLSIWYMSGGSEPSYEIYNGLNVWSDGEPITLMFVNGELQLIASNGTILFQDYYLGDFTIDQISGANSVGANAFSKGYVTIEVTEDVSAQAMSLLDQLIPIVSLVITLGVIGVLLDKLMKKVGA